MKFWLIILRIICGIQLVLAVFKSFTSLASLLTDGGFIYFLQAAAYAIIAILPVQVFIILSVNFPDKPIAGRQKKNFNRVFLINFLLIAFLFGFVFYDYRKDASLAAEAGLVHPVFYINFCISIVMLVFHFIILYALFWLRNHVYKNAMQKQFDFEMQDENT